MRFHVSYGQLLTGAKISARCKIILCTRFFPPIFCGVTIHRTTSQNAFTCGNSNLREALDTNMYSNLIKKIAYFVFQHVGYKTLNIVTVTL